jgi:hypothetical protein
MKRFFILAAVAAMCAVPAIVLAQLENPTGLSIPLLSQNDSGEIGTVTFLQDGKDLIVSAQTWGGVAATQPIHIHEGTCANLNPVPKYPLKSLENGMSYTRLEGVSLDSLLSSKFAVNVHKSTTEVKVYVACGDIKLQS